jgi:hypothetical protein
MNFAKIGIRGLMAVLLGCTVSAAAFAADGTPDSAAASPSAALWAGAAFKSRATAGYAGGVWAPMTHSLDADGILVRGEYVYVSYDFNSRNSGTGEAHGTLNRANAQIGYQMVRYGLAGSLFVGPDYQDYSVSPSRAESHNVNDKLGAMFVGRVARAGAQEFPVSLEGNFSTANTTYWTRLRPGMNFGEFTVGPELGALGNRDYDEGRYGAFASINLGSAVILQTSIGYSQSFRRHVSATSGGEGAYGEVSLVVLTY